MFATSVAKCFAIRLRVQQMKKKIFRLNDLQLEVASFIWRNGNFCKILCPLLAARGVSQDMCLYDMFCIFIIDLHIYI